METEAEYDQSLFPQSEYLSPAHHNQKFKRLNKNTSAETNFNISSSSPLNDSDELEKENEWDDGLDPLFVEENQFSAKRVLEFDENEDGFSQDGADFELGSSQNNKSKKRKGESSSVKLSDNKWSTKKERSKKKEKPVISSKGKEKKERKARLAQQADYQRVMRERRGVGFKPAPMVEKSVSSVLEKIRQRKLEVSKKVMSSRSVEHTRSENVPETSTSVAQVNITSEDKSCPGDEQTRCDNAAETSTDAAALDSTSDDKPHLNDEQTNNNKPLVDETTQSFRAPINDTQDLFLDSERNNSQGDELNDPGGPLDDVAPSAPSLSLKFDSALPDSPDDISSDEEVSDKENIEPHPEYQFKGKSPATGDPVKAFVDEEALEDDSDNDLLHCQGNDEEDNSDMEENCDYIATDFKEKQIDREKNHLLHQQWDQQEDETRTKNLLHKLKYGTKKSEPSLFDDDEEADESEDNKEDVGRTEDEEDESDKEVSDVPASRASTKKLKQMIPLMFTDVDDDFVSSEDEESEKRLSKQCLLHKVEMEQQSQFLSPAEEETSREVFCRIKKLNVVPETKKKAKASSIFDSLLNKGSSNNSSKSSFLRRASSHPAPAPSSHRQGPSTGKSYIFGRDDSNSRSSMSLLEGTANLGQKENQVKKSSSAKFTSSQSKRNTQHREVRSETAHETSLFDILRASSAQTGYDDSQDNLVDQQAVFSAFKSVKKQVKIEGRSYQGS